MRKAIWTTLAAATLAYGGGFYLELGNPAASAEAQSKNAVLTARLTGCHEPEKATIEGTAEGTIDGKRQSIPLKVQAMATPGMYAIAQLWPNEGTWVIRLIATQVDGKTQTILLAKVRGGTFDRSGVKYMTLRTPTADEVERLLKTSD